MPKVLRIINRFNLGGPTYNAGYLTKYLPSQYETLLIGGKKDDSEASSEYILEKLDIKPLIIDEMRRSINPFQDIAAYRRIKKIIKEFQPDIVHTHASKAGFAGRLAAKQCKVPVIVHTFHGHVFHSYFNPVITAVFKNIERRLAKYTTAIIAISDIQKKEIGTIHKICSPDKIHVVPLGFDLSRFTENIQEKRDQFRETYKIKEDEIAVGIIGRVVPIKNHKLFIDAIKKIYNNTDKPVKAFIIGDGESKQEIVDYVKQTGLPYSTEEYIDEKSVIVFTSWIREIDFATSGLDIIALTSLNEGTPVSLIEAQAANKPIVSTKVGGIDNVVKEGETALLAELDNPDEFISKLQLLTEDDLLRQKMSSNASEFVNKNFTYTKLCKNVSDLYERLLS